MPSSMHLPLVAALSVCSIVAAQEAQHLDLKVLYAGVPEHPRTAEWKRFLAAHTAGVQVVDVTKFSARDAAGWDVVIFDCPDPIVRKEDGTPTRIAVPKPVELTADFGRPAIVVGGMAMLTDRLKLKSNWL